MGKVHFPPWKLTPKHNGIIMHVFFKYLYAIQFVDNAFGPKSSNEIKFKANCQITVLEMLCEKNMWKGKKQPCILFCKKFGF